MPSVAEILAARIGVVVAPAGCGKTHLIVDALAEPTCTPILVLTHTTAGVAALRQRLVNRGISSSHYRLSTIAGWAMNMISMFPFRAGYQIDPLASPDYPANQRAANALCQSGHIDDLLAATYARLFVDEYQDCSISQHQMIVALSGVLPTVVFGDPMQAIFGFNRDPLPNWEQTVQAVFPVLGYLQTPWRWRNANAPELGQWLLGARTSLSQGQSIDLRSCPNHITWHQLSGQAETDLRNQVNAQYQISREHPNQTLLIIGDSIQVAARHRYASRSRGVSVVERVDYPDVMRAAENMVGRRGGELLEATVNFLKTVMVNVLGDRIFQRVETIAAGRNRTPPTEPELAALALRDGGGYLEAVAFMESMSRDQGRRVFRHSAYGVMVEALNRAAADHETPLNEVVSQIHEKHRHAGRSVMGKAIGSTLLLKGLEADHVLILDADTPDGARRMNAKHLYVALSRGAKSVTIFSRSPLLP